MVARGGRGGALVVGAASAIGKAVVRRLAVAGHHVAAADKCANSISKIVEENTKIGTRVEGVAVDIDRKGARTELFDQVLKKLEVLDSLVIIPSSNDVKGDITSATKMQFDQLFHSQLTLPFRLIQEAAPHLAKSKNGSVVMFASMAGFTPFIDIGLYSVTQTAILGMTKALAQSLGRKQVRVNTVCLGMVEEDGSGAVWDSQDEKVKQELKSMIPLGRLGRGADAASLTEFLISQHASYVHGENVVLSGGISVRL